MDKKKKNLKAVFFKTKGTRGGPPNFPEVFAGEGIAKIQKI